MKKVIGIPNLIIRWSDGKTENLALVLPEYLRNELRIYFDELEALRAEHDAGLRDEPYHFEGEAK